ncbi:hypothetical protein HXA34_02365 [Salipaludibacillus agaradhaerens]|uniref:AbrB/MazE/SpoVT family DNA-binding domain-containing protein n=1 Tax=Salipaludibacillus agaradhaerens TaxID=76935 RepID=UPI002151A3DD|nr:hypothetical protein [Salipaludibacillus agaradhaerens]MCR6117174.1 hypothetical protein [Salipaludibacillus agaradhaerens]UJW56369.1 hypothetical protein HXZ66_02515 [Bacillus sp. A116_S68]
MENAHHLTLINTHLTCTFSRHQTVRLPYELRKKLPFLQRESVSVIFGDNQHEIKIVRPGPESYHNEMSVNKNGTIRIPSEIKKFMSIKEGDVLSIFLFHNHEGLVLYKCQ